MPSLGQCVLPLCQSPIPRTYGCFRLGCQINRGFNARMQIPVFLIPIRIVTFLHRWRHYITTLRNRLMKLCRNLVRRLTDGHNPTHVPVQLRGRQRIFGEFVEARVQLVLDLGEPLTHPVRPLALRSDVVHGVFEVGDDLTRLAHLGLDEVLSLLHVAELPVLNVRPGCHYCSSLIRSRSSIVIAGPPWSVCWKLTVALFSVAL